MWAGRWQVLGANRYWGEQEAGERAYLYRTRVLLWGQRRAGCVTAGGGRVRAARKESVKGLDYALAGSGQVAGERANLGLHLRVRWVNASVGDGCGRGGVGADSSGVTRLWETVVDKVVRG